MALVTLRDAHIGFGNRIGPAKSGPLFRPTTGLPARGRWSRAHELRQSGHAL